MNLFICKICNKEHEFYGSIELLEPDILYNMSKEEKEKRVITIDLFYLIDKSFLLTKGDLFIKIQNEDIYMHWVVWVKLTPNEYIKMSENLEGETSMVEGELAVQIPNYQDSLGVKVNLIYDLNNRVKYPEVKIIKTENKLSYDFEKGLPIEEVVSWMEQIYHSN